MIRRFVCICLVAAVSATAAFAHPPATVPTVPAGKLALEAVAPTIDGHVDDAAWNSVEPHSAFTQQDPFEGAPATEKTEVRILVGHGHVYVGIICFDKDPSSIIVSQARRDAALNDTDSVIVVFDTFNDSQNAFVFGTNPLGIEYDGQVAGEGQTGGNTFGTGGGTGGSQRGGISAFNANWDGDWTVQSAITDRGWEAELAIPLKTLRYDTGDNRTWGFNVLRNIRHKNEQVYLAPIPRGFDIYRVSLAAKLTNLDLPGRRDIKLIPYALASANRDYTVSGAARAKNKGDVGLDLKWGVTPNITMDFTLNTDFAQVEADEEQVNLTRFDLFFPEKRPFFLENASTFQFGNPQQVDLFFSRRIGLSGFGSSGVPLDIHGGTRLSGKLGAWRVGVLDIQTGAAHDASGRLLAPANNFAVARVQREVGRSSFGGIYVNRQGTGSHAGRDNWNRAYGVDANIALSQNSRVFAYLAGTTSPDSIVASRGTDTAGRVFYDFRNNLWQVSGGYSRVGQRFNPEAGFLPRRGYSRPEGRVFLQYQPKRWPWIRRISPHVSYDAYHDLATGERQTSRAHLHYFEIQPARGGRFGNYVEISSDRPLIPFAVFNTAGRRVVIPPGKFTWNQFLTEVQTDPSAVASATFRHRIGGFYDGDFHGWDMTSSVRVGSRFVGSLGWTRQHADLPGGTFTTHLVPVKASYAFTTLASVQALVQYNSQTSQFSSNIRLALLNRSGTGLFVVYNDRRDTSDFNPVEVLGRSFIVKYTRLLDF